MLETVNPAAVDEIGGAQATGPFVSESVIYVARNGEGRSGKTEFPALVMRDATPGSDALELLIVYDANDVIVREVPKQTDSNPAGCWKPRREMTEQTFNPNRLQDVRKQVADLTKELEALKTAVFGEYEPPKMSIIDHLVEFERQVKVATAGKSPPAKKTAKKK